MRSRLFLLSAAAAGLMIALAARKESAIHPGFLSGEDFAGQDSGLIGSLLNSLGAFGVVRTSAMRGLKPALLDNRNVRAMLAVIRRGEGTADSDGYRRMFGGALFTGFADHPRKSHCFTLKNGSRLCSTAAGAYQFLARSWDETKNIMGLPDFSPVSQDMAAVGRIAARGALDDVLMGRFEAALKKLAYEWASLPGSPYGQPVISLAAARQTYLASGGFIPGTVVT